MGPNGFSGSCSDTGAVDLDICGNSVADPTRLNALAVLYAELINGDLIQRQIRKISPAADVLGATAVTDPATDSGLPLIDVVGLAHTPADAARVSRAGANLFRSNIADQQASAGIPLNQRVLLQVVSTRAKLVAGRKKTLPIIAFIAVMIATVGLTFVLENLRPRVYAVEPTASEHSAPTAAGARRGQGIRALVMIAHARPRVPPDVRGHLGRRRPRNTLLQCPQRA